MTDYFKTVCREMQHVSEQVGVLYVCVHLCTSGVSEPVLLIVETGMEAIGVAEINAKTVWSAMKLSRTLMQPVSTVNKISDHIETSSVRNTQWASLLFDLELVFF